MNYNNNNNNISENKNDIIESASTTSDSSDIDEDQSETVSSTVTDDNPNVNASNVDGDGSWKPIKIVPNLLDVDDNTGLVLEGLSPPESPLPSLLPTQPLTHDNITINPEHLTKKAGTPFIEEPLVGNRDHRESLVSKDEIITHTVVENTVLEIEIRKTKSRRTFREFLTKYCCAGQIKRDDLVDRGPAPYGSSWFYANYIWKRPYWITWSLPLFIVYTIWLSYMFTTNRWNIFGADENDGIYGFYMTITMIFGSFVAGATSEGGGSIAYPIMTLVLGLKSSTARDFSLMIQSVGMTSASFTIFYSQITICNVALIYSSIGGTFGIVGGLYLVAPFLPDDFSKMIFVSVWLAFAINLFVLNRQKKRLTNLDITDNSAKTKLILFGTGVIGGILSSIAGSGIDICTFSVLTLLFRLTEKTATPTSVLLMAGNTVVGMITRAFIMNDVDPQTWNFWLCAVPAVCVGAPVGAYISSFLHRQVLACFVYITDTTQFIAACILTKMTIILSTLTTVILFGSLGFFFLLRRLGESRLIVIPPVTNARLPVGSTMVAPSLLTNSPDKYGRIDNVANIPSLELSAV